MNEDFDRFEMNTLKYTKQYRHVSIMSIIIFATWTVYRCYSAFLGNHASIVKWLNTVVFYILLINLVMSCALYKLVRIIEKLKLKAGLEVP